MRGGARANEMLNSLPRGKGIFCERWDAKQVEAWKETGRAPNTSQLITEVSRRPLPRR